MEVSSKVKDLDADEMMKVLRNVLVFYDEGVACHGHANRLLAKRRKRKRDYQGHEKEDSHDPTKNGM